MHVFARREILLLYSRLRLQEIATTFLVCIAFLFDFIDKLNKLINNMHKERRGHLLRKYGLSGVKVCISLIIIDVSHLAYYCVENLVMSNLTDWII